MIKIDLGKDRIIDLLSYVDCSVEKIRNESLKINPDMKIFEISCKTGQGLNKWHDWLKILAHKK